MFKILVLLFTIIPALEIYFLIKIGTNIGGLNTFLIVMVTGIIGAALAKSQGIQILQKIQIETQNGSLPADQLFHGFLVFAGGLLLLTPGFITDLLGLSMVFPGTRHIVVLFFKEAILKAIQKGNVHVYTNTNSHDSQFSTNRYNSQQNKQQNSIEADYYRKNENN